MSSIRTLGLLAASLATLACSDSTADPEPTGSDANRFVMASDEFTLAPGEERYICYTTKAPRELNMNRFHIDNFSSVHHMFFARTLAPEQDEPFECDVLFKPNWLPLFTTGAGEADLNLPEGAALPVAEGEQLLMQLHLLNSTNEPMTETVQIEAQTIDRSDLQEEAVLFPFGTTILEVPPKTESAITHDCVIHRDMDVFAAFAHMHVLGNRMTFEIGDDADSMKQAYSIDYDFDNQIIEPTKFKLKKGQHTRTTCNYKNTTDQTVRYGEGTYDEMCFFSVFVTGGQALDGECVDTSGLGGSGGSSGTVGDCSKATENEIGIGAPCTKDGGECQTGLSCSSSLGGDSDDGVCISVGQCASSSDCGSGATCCAPAQSGGAINICIADPCRPKDCAPVD